MTSRLVRGLRSRISSTSGPAAAEVRDRLEQRHADELGTRLARELLGIEDVVGRPRHRDDQPVDGGPPVPRLSRGGRREGPVKPFVRARGPQSRARGRRALRREGRTFVPGRGDRRTGRRRHARRGATAAARRARPGRREARHRPRTRRHRADRRSPTSAARNGSSASPSSGTAPITVVDIPHAAPSAVSSARYSCRASCLARSSASSIVSAPTFGFPSRSPPIQLPKRNAPSARGAAPRAPARDPGRRSRTTARRTRGPGGSRRRRAAFWSGSRRSARAA